MIWYRNVDRRYPFLWDSAAQPPARWHGPDEGPANYFADTPDGAWAEFLRHEEIDDLADLAGVSRAIWAVEVRPTDTGHPTLPETDLVGDESTYPACRQEARTIRLLGCDSVESVSAALKSGEAAGWQVDDREFRCPPPRDGRVLVLFGSPAGKAEGWVVSPDARPSARLLDSVQHF